jgi:hypothetical protein
MSVYELPHQGRICSARDCAGCQCRYRETILQHWEYISLLRNGVVAFSETKDFHDAQFEYRWKSEWAVSRYVCTVEIRPSGDVDIHYKVPEISLAYADPHSHRPFHKYTAHDVVIGSKLAHAILKASDCERISLIYWMK